MDEYIMVECCDGRYRRYHRSGRPCFDMDDTQIFSAEYYWIVNELANCSCTMCAILDVCEYSLDPYFSNWDEPGCLADK